MRMKPVTHMALLASMKSLGNRHAELTSNDARDKARQLLRKGNTS